MTQLNWRARTRTGVSTFFATVAAAMALLLVAVPAAADPRDDQARINQELAKTKAALESSTERAATAGIAFADASRLLPDVQRKLAEARGVLAAARAAAKTADEVSRQAADDLSDADRELGVAQARVEKTTEGIGTYSANAYKGRNIAGVQGMLSVQNPADFVAGLTYMEQVAGVERQMLDQHTQAQAEANDRLSAQAIRKQAADQAQQQASAAVRSATAAEAAAVQAQSEVAALVAQREQALQVAEQERAANEARMRELQAESDKIAAEIRAMAAGGGQTVRDGARLPMPVKGWKSSDFGMRYDPFYNVWQLHAGADFAAPAGSPIWAAASGIVFRAGWNGGYGNYTCVYHGTYQGKGFATCYAHQSAILVRGGQQVRQGQVIGRVGTTGASTGNHLHFEVRLDGTPTDPVPWLPGCLC
jgi:murein DD-endopeptidase MepM/ murein hydrolase activator NlpD